MSDIVERLRDLAAIDNCQASREAAAEIERLRAEVEMMAAKVIEAEKYNGWHQQACLENTRLRAALKMFACDCKGKELCAIPERCTNYIARAALAQPAQMEE